MLARKTCGRHESDSLFFMNSYYIKKIKCPTLAIWGDNDLEAPVEDAKELEGIMLDAALIVLPGSHYAYIENLGQVVNILNNFMRWNYVL